LKKEDIQRLCTQFKDSQVPYIKDTSALLDNVAYVYLKKDGDFLFDVIFLFALEVKITSLLDIANDDLNQFALALEKLIEINLDSLFDELNLKEIGELNKVSKYTLQQLKKHYEEEDAFSFHVTVEIFSGNMDDIILPRLKVLAAFNDTVKMNFSFDIVKMAIKWLRVEILKGNYRDYKSVIAVFNGYLAKIVLAHLKNPTAFNKYKDVYKNFRAKFFSQLKKKKKEDIAEVIKTAFATEMQRFNKCNVVIYQGDIYKQIYALQHSDFCRIKLLETVRQLADGSFGNIMLKETDKPDVVYQQFLFLPSQIWLPSQSRYEDLSACVQYITSFKDLMSLFSFVILKFREQANKKEKQFFDIKTSINSFGKTFNKLFKEKFGNLEVVTGEEFVKFKNLYRWMRDFSDDESQDAFDEIAIRLKEIIDLPRVSYIPGICDEKGERRRPSVVEIEEGAYERRYLPTLGKGGYAVTSLFAQENQFVVVKREISSDDRDDRDETLNHFRKDLVSWCELGFSSKMAFFGGRIYKLLLPYVEGQTLKQYFEKSQQHSEQDKLKIFISVAKAVKGLHDEKVTHGDLKEDNIMITKSDNEITLIDFGRRKRVGRDVGLVSWKELEDSRKFAPYGHIPPELQYLPKLRVPIPKPIPAHPSQDIYSLGSVFSRLRLPIQDQLFKQMQTANPWERPNIDEVIEKLKSALKPQTGTDEAPGCRG
jgi:serine/threonine protein kinase